MIHCAGTVFLAQADLGAIFLRRALDTIEDGRSELVPLLHLDGLDLLLISPATAVACLYDRWTLADLAELKTLSAVPVPHGDALLSKAGGRVSTLNTAAWVRRCSPSFAKRLDT